MPWTKRDYPDSMKNLPAAVRDKAIGIANALLKQRDIDEGIVIATAISRAKDWAVNHGKKAEASHGASHTTDVKHHGADRYVIPVEDGWRVKREGASRAVKYDTKREAVMHAREEAKHDNASLTIQGRDGKIQSRVSYNPRNSGKTQGHH